MNRRRRLGAPVAVVLVLALAPAALCDPPRQNWKFGLQFCGDSQRAPGEECDPPGVQGRCATGLVCTGNCRCAPPCDCCALGASALEFSTTLGTGVCGQATTGTGLFRALDCNGVYIGSGGAAPPATGILSDGVHVVFSVASCDGAKQTLTLQPMTQAMLGSPEGCTAAGCLVGPPMPLVSAPPDSPAWSHCVVTRIGAGGAAGTASCDGTLDATLPLVHELFFTGDLLPQVPGVQPCPLCVQNRCVGGLNNGMDCRPEGTQQDAAHPTSGDCPPSPSLSVGSIVLPARVTTGPIATKSLPIGPFQTRVFCGYCRDAAGTGAFETPPHPCLGNSDCWKKPYLQCEQRANGAFGPSGGAVEHITLEGAPPGCLADGGWHSASLAAAECAAKTASPFADAIFGLPGPEALSLTGEMRLH